MTDLFRKIISASLSPNTTGEDVRAAWRVLFSPWTWKKGESQLAVAEWFRETYSVDHVCFFQSGRVALYEVLTALGIGDGNEVLVQAFTCVAVPNSVMWVGAVPVYVDIDESLNVDPKDAAKKITPRTKAIIVQHTFGMPADVVAIMKLAKKYKLLVIEDCAHAIGATYEGKKLGSYGDAAFFSFGRDKAVSSVWGGAAIINRSCPVKSAKERIKHAEQKLPDPGVFWIFQQVLHPVAFSWILPTYRLGIGKALLVLLQRLHLLSKPVAPEELRGRQPEGAFTRYPNALAQLLEIQLKKLPEMIRLRRQAVAYFEQYFGKATIISRSGASYLRYPLLVNNPLDAIRVAKMNGILLGNWYHNVIDPYHTDFAAIGYVRGSCPRAESAAAHILNLPTLLTGQELHRVANVVQ